MTIVRGSYGFQLPLVESPIRFTAGLSSYFLLASSPLMIDWNLIEFQPGLDEGSIMKWLIQARADIINKCQWYWCFGWFSSWAGDIINHCGCWFKLFGFWSNYLLVNYLITYSPPPAPLPPPLPPPAPTPLLLRSIELWLTNVVVSSQ